MNAKMKHPLQHPYKLPYYTHALSTFFGNADVLIAWIVGIGAKDNGGYQMQSYLTLTAL
jgi:hypothetical protein